MCPAGIIGSLDENSVDLKKNTAGSRSNQNIIFLFLAGGQKKIMEGREGCQGITCGNMPKITVYLPPQIIKIIYSM